MGRIWFKTKNFWLLKSFMLSLVRGEQRSEEITSKKFCEIMLKVLTMYLVIQNDMFSIIQSKWGCVAWFFPCQKEKACIFSKFHFYLLIFLMHFPLLCSLQKWSRCPEKAAESKNHTTKGAAGLMGARGHCETHGNFQRYLIM